MMSLQHQYQHINITHMLKSPSKMSLKNSTIGFRAHFLSLFDYRMCEWVSAVNISLVWSLQCACDVWWSQCLGAFLFVTLHWLSPLQKGGHTLLHCEAMGGLLPHKAMGGLKGGLCHQMKPNPKAEATRWIAHRAQGNLLQRQTLVCIVAWINTMTL